MRADRLIAVLLLLQTRGRVTAAEVAQELKVSERTARRDLEALALSGVPVYSTHGRGGGWQLIGGARTDLSGLSQSEAQAVFLAAGSALDSPHLSASLKSGLRKLTSALPETFRSEAAAAAAAIKIDSVGWGQSDYVENTRFVDVLTRAVISQRQVRMVYAGPRSSAPADVPRTVHPLGLVMKRMVWYLIADTDAGRRTFRLGRIQDLEVLDVPSVRPADFDLDDAWDNVVSNVESHRPTVRVEASADADILGPLRFTFGSELTVHDDKPDAENQVRITVHDFHAKSMAARLAGFGASITLHDAPPEVVEHLHRITAELQALFQCS